MAGCERSLIFFSFFLFILPCFGAKVDEKMNQSKRTTPNPSSLIECACFPPDKCENKDHCFADYGCFKVQHGENMRLGCTVDEPVHQNICDVNPFSHIFPVACCRNGTRCNLNLSLHLQTWPVNHTGANMNEKTNQSKRTTPNPSSLIECACFPPDKCENKDHCFTDYGCFKFLHEEKMTLGCTDDEPRHRMICGMNASHISAVACCHNGTRCNLNLSLQLQSYPVNHTETASVPLILDLLLYIGLPLIGIFICIGIIVMLIHFKRKKNSLHVQGHHLLVGEGIRTQQTGNSAQGKMPDESCTSGSVSGLSFIAQRTVARQVNLVESIGMCQGYKSQLL